ncbi:uncharacterized protein LOC126576055 isoform X3 [Anopheles aquasalis]|uniref:uncharacterized protein LOC126576055 isoform X3 n=1 Tax=Anopheles aquasalis TaxID=42839 RepID=UPI00215A7686|nr:uncharacterized protein LOC126576055 isoform X3 [Anopheles aquasalis]
MTSSEPIDTINQLPDKVLGAIFDYLDKEEVKNASLVCNRWNHIIFHSPYIERFQLMLYDGSIRAREREMLETIEPTLVRTSARQQKQMKRKMQQQIRQQALKEVLQSRRCYRYISYYMDYDFALQTMTTHRLQQLQKLWLDVNTTCFTSLDIWITFANAIPLMAQLHTLYIETSSSEGVCAYNVALIVSSASVKLLSIDYDFPLVADMPALETYKGPLDNLHRFGPNMPRNQFDKMQKLTIIRSEYANKWTVNDYREFFRRLPNLQRIKTLTFTVTATFHMQKKPQLV